MRKTVFDVSATQSNFFLTYLQRSRTIVFDLSAPQAKFCFDLSALHEKNRFCLICVVGEIFLTYLHCMRKIVFDLSTLQAKCFLTHLHCMRKTVLEFVQRGNRGDGDLLVHLVGNILYGQRLCVPLNVQAKIKQCVF